MRDKIRDAESVRWENTGVGFFSTIKLNSPIPVIPTMRMWQYNFRHPDFPHGGSYMCYIVDDQELELEAVTFGGADWPNPSDPNDFDDLQ